MRLLLPPGVHPGAGAVREGDHLSDVIELDTPGAMIRWAREQAELSQDALAERLGCHRSLIGHWESGRYGGISGENFLAAAHACGFDVVFEPMGQGG